MLSRGQVSKQFDIAESTLRFYEKEGLVVPSFVKGDANRRRAYSEDDIERLHRLVILKEYGFELDSIRQILDGEVDMVDALDDQLDGLLREVNRVRDLILFLKFLQVTDSDLIYGLEFGPEDIDAFADLVRDSPLYREAMARIRGYSDEDLQRMFDELDDIVHDFVTVDPDLEFAGIEREIRCFCGWWDENIASVEDGGYFGFWAIFEDDSVVVSEVERVGGETASSSLQMHAYYAWMKHLMIDSGDLVRAVAESAAEDVVLAMEEAAGLVGFVNLRMAGGGNSVELAEHTIGCMREILADADLMDFLGLEGELAFGVADLEKVVEVIALLGDGS